MINLVLRLFYRLLVEVKGIFLNLDRYGAILPHHSFNDTIERQINSIEYRRFLVFCYERTKFWKKKFDYYGVNPYKDSFFDVNRKLPILTKREVIENKFEICPSLFFRILHFSSKSKTGGSTGEGLTFYTSRKFRRAQWKTWQRHWFEEGVPVNSTKIWVGGKNIFPDWYPDVLVYCGVTKTLYLNIYKLELLEEKRLIGLVLKMGICWVHGYPSTVTDLFRRFSLLGKYISFVTVSSETLLHSQMQFFISKGIKLVNHYGMAEGVLNFSKKTDVWKSDEDFAHFYTEELDGIVKAIGTGYSNKLFPLINYDVNDTLELNSGKIINIAGRVDDFIQLPSGKRLYRLDHLFKGIESINKAQLIQHSVKEILCVLSIADDFNFNDVTEQIISRFRKMHDESVLLKFDLTGDFQKSKNGKIKMVVNRISY